MYSKGKGMTDLENRVERIGAKAQMGNFAQKLKAVFFRLKRVFLSIAVAKNLERGNFYFNPLSFSQRFDQQAGY